MKNTTLNLVFTTLFLFLLFPHHLVGEGYSLAECRELALKNNVAVKNADLEVAASEQTKRAAFTNYFPTVSATGMLFKNSEKLVDLGVVSLIDKVNFGGIVAMQPLFAGGGMLTGNRLAGVGKEVSEKRRVLSRNEVLLKVEEQYWGVVALDEKIATADLYGKMLDDLVKQAEDAYRLGVIAKNDLLKVTVQRQEVQLQQLQLANGRQIAPMALCQFLGIEYDPLLVLTDTLKEPLPPESVYLEAEKALPLRAESSLLDLNVRAEKLRTRMKLGEYLPQLGLGAAGYYMKTMPDQGKYQGALFLSLSVPISGWWGGSSVLQERKYRERMAENNRCDNSELMLLEIRKGWYELTESYREVDLAVKLASQAEENLRVNDDSYRQGLSLLSDLLDAQAMFQQSRSRLADARKGNRLKLIRYLHATGRYAEAERL